jgi:hypothetical protein
MRTYIFLIKCWRTIRLREGVPGGKEPRLKRPYKSRRHLDDGVTFLFILDSVEAFVLGLISVV